MPLTPAGWFTVLVPTVGPMMTTASRVPSFDDVEKMLQLFGIVSALLLSVVANAASYDYEFPSDKIAQGRAYSAFGLVMVALIHLLVTYIYLVTTVDQESKEEEEKQMKKWWQFGKLNLFLQVFLLVYTLVEYITYVNITLYDGYQECERCVTNNEFDGTNWQTDSVLALYGADNCFGLFHSFHIEYAVLIVFLLVHLFALPVMLYNDTMRRSRIGEVGGARQGGPGQGGVVRSTSTRMST